MAKFRAEVEAKQWHPGVKIEGVDEAGGPFGFFTDSSGEPWNLAPGNWIVLWLDGRREVVADHVFRATFMPEWRK